MIGEEQWKCDDCRLVERRVHTWGVMNINTQVYRAPLTGRNSEESAYIHAHTWNRRWRTMENWMLKSLTECRAGGRTGRECRYSLVRLKN